MKVGLSTRTLEPALRPTLDGLGVYTAALLEHLPTEGVTVQGYAWAPRGDASQLTLSQPFPGRYASQLCHTLLPWGAALDLPVDVVHFTDYRVVRTRTPSVATVHDAIPLKHPDWVGGRWRHLKNWALRTTVARADHFIAVSRYAMAELIEYYRLPPDRISVVPCGIDPAWLQPLPTDLAKRRQTLQLPGQPYFLFVGTFQPRKNLDRIIAAHQSLPASLQQAHPLVVVGQPGWDCDHTVQHLRTLQATGAPVVWLAGVRDRDNLRAIYAGALALAFPSLYEGFGIPVLEAYACGTAVLTATAASLPEVAGDAALLVDPERTDAIAEAMRQLAEDTALRQTLARRGLARAQSYTWANTARELRAIYRELSASAT